MSNGEEVISSIWENYAEERDPDDYQFKSNTKLSFQNISKILQTMHALMKKNTEAIEELKSSRVSFFAGLSATKQTIITLGIMLMNSIVATGIVLGILKATGKI